jgi:hypothetical protein
MFQDMRLGRTSSPPDDRNFRLAKYLRKPELPAAPPKVDYSQAVLDIGGYGMLANDKLGCCVIAAMMHLAMQQSDNNGRPLPIPSDSEVVRAYSAIGGYVPGEDWTDQGCSMSAALKYWRKHGLLIDGKLHRIAAYASVNTRSLPELTAALWLFGGIFAGYALPLAAKELASWTNPPLHVSGKWKPGSWGGHTVVQCDTYRGLMQTVTWGRLIPTDERFFKAFCDEAWVVVSGDWLGEDNKCPAGFDGAALMADLALLGTRRTPQELLDPVWPHTARWDKPDD